MPLHHLLRTLFLLTAIFGQVSGNAGSTYTNLGGDPVWVPDVPAAPYSHPEPNANPNILYEPSIPGRPVVSDITATSMRLTWSPPLLAVATAPGAASSSPTAPVATISEYRIYRQEYQWSQSYHDGASLGGTSPSDLHHDTLRHETQTFSSAHPYLNDQDRTALIAFPGAVNISIHFHPSTDLEHAHDWLQYLPNTQDPNHPQTLEDGVDRHDLPSSRLSGRAAVGTGGTGTNTDHAFDAVVYPWPGVGPHPPLVIQGDRCVYRFYSDGSVGHGNGTNPNSRWGYEFVATGTFLVQTPTYVGGFHKVESHDDVSGSTDYDGRYTTQVVHQLTRRTSYRFVVSAKNQFQSNNRTGAWSPLSQPSLRATTLATLPSPPPAPPTVTHVGATTMTVHWVRGLCCGGGGCWLLVVC